MHDLIIQCFRSGQIPENEFIQMLRDDEVLNKRYRRELHDSSQMPGMQEKMV